MKRNLINPIIFVYADGSIDNRAHYIMPESLEINRKGVKPATVFIPKGLVHPEVSQRIEWALYQHRGRMQTYPVGELPSVYLKELEREQH